MNINLENKDNNDYVSKRSSRNYAQVYTCGCYFHGSVTKVQFCRQIVVRSNNTKLHENLSSECHNIPAGGWMYRQPWKS